ncbi:MAG: RNA polymerase sigma factor [Bacteroidota bacterium]
METSKGTSIEAEAGSTEFSGEVQSVFRRERKRLLAFISRRIPNEEEAEDVLQDVFYQLLETLQRMVPVRQVLPWLFQVSRNKIADRYRKSEARPAAESLSEAEESFLASWLGNTSDGPEDTLFREGIWEAFQQALGELPDHQRWVFEQHELEGRSFKELAADTGESVNTLLSRKRYAVLYLRDVLQNWYDDL